MKKKNILFQSVLGITLCMALLMMGLIYKEVKENKRRNLLSEDGDFGINFIKISNQTIGKTNYMISPYSVEIALSMLREAASGTTKEEISSVAPERSIKTLDIKDRLSIANVLFIKDSKKEFIYPEYVELLRDKYQAEVIYDRFQTPEVINNWVDKNTNHMIPKILDRIDSDYIFGLGNAIALEEDWESPFQCEKTTKEKFNKSALEKISVAMMHKKFETTVSYYEDEEIQALAMPYKSYSYDGKETKEGEQLEFIGILPNDIEEYINNLSLDKIKKLDEEKEIASESNPIQVSIPRFEFDYDFKKFKDSLKDMGIKEAFTNNADFSNLIQNEKVTVNEAIHKTYVKVNEKGTKAAAVSYFGGTYATAMEEEKKREIIFDRPFIFVIKDTESEEILFFGVVYEPERWAGANCQE